jgi:hypothetical protein
MDHDLLSKPKIKRHQDRQSVLALLFVVTTMGFLLWVLAATAPA